MTELASRGGAEPNVNRIQPDPRKVNSETRPVRSDARIDGLDVGRAVPDMAGAQESSPTFARPPIRGFFGTRAAPRAGRRDWRHEAPAEFEVGRILTELDSVWTVLRTFDVFGALDADFVVVGPAGVFTISARIPAGKKVWVDENVLWTNGRPTDHIRNARLSADRASECLARAGAGPVRVTPIIALCDPASLNFGGDPARRVKTLPANLIVQWLSERPREHSDEAVAYFAMLAEERATWASQSSESGPVARLR